jgi:DNA-binding HxlR family transcriptional regulator
MRMEPARLSGLMRLIPTASKKALRANLRSLEAAQIVVRRDFSDTLLHVEYDLVDDTREIIWAILPRGERSCKQEQKPLPHRFA